MGSFEDLAGLSFFSVLTRAHLGRLSSVARTVAFPAGKVIFSEGDEARDLFFVMEGRVSIEIAIPGRGPSTIMSVKKGDVFGWSAFVPPHEETATARALEPVTAIVLDGARLRDVCETDLELGYRIARAFNIVLAMRLQAVRMQLMDLYGAPAEVRREDV